MGENLVTALEITIVGMGLVFGAIILLWLVMIALVRLTAEQAEVEAQKTEELELKRRAAIAAVAVALARVRNEDQPHPFPLPPTAIVTAWQAVQRGRLLSQKGPKK
jgi:Na+-transporting methylmalonyl-CoA/oxaloacetate decarboxylase gamma subunit